MTVSVRTGVKFARAVCWRPGQGADPDAFTPWCADRGLLNEMIEARRVRGWTVLYIVTATVKD